MKSNIDCCSDVVYFVNNICFTDEPITQTMCSYACACVWIWLPFACVIGFPKRFACTNCFVCMCMCARITKLIELIKISHRFYSISLMILLFCMLWRSKQINEPRRRARACAQMYAYEHPTHDTYYLNIIIQHQIGKCVTHKLANDNILSSLSSTKKIIIIIIPKSLKKDHSKNR